MTQHYRLLIKELRQSRDLSQEELAQALNTSRQSIISLESGEYLPSFPLLVSLMQYFGCPIEDLVEGLSVGRQNKIRKGGESKMQLTPWSPFSALDQIRDEMDSLFDRSLSRIDFSRVTNSALGAMNIHEDEKAYEIEIQAPGFKEKDVTIEMTEDTLSISGKKEAKETEKKKAMVRREWSHAEFARTIRFASPIVAEKAEAKLEDGLLTITAPKVEPIKPKTTKIEVKKK